MDISLNVFISYSHKDEAFKDKLNSHLVMLRRSKLINSWQDRNIGAGDEWKKEILGNLEAADIILLLVSDNFLASDFCWDEEMTRALEYHDKRQARVIPIILKPIDWKDAPFSKLQALPKDAKAVTTWSNEDEAYAYIATEIRKVVENMVKNPEIIEKKSAPKKVSTSKKTTKKNTSSKATTVIVEESSPKSERSSAKNRRLRQKIDDLTQQLESIYKKLFLLEKSRILETRVEEKFRLDDLILEYTKQRDQIESEINNLEEQLA